jgi:hypothetical protein
MTKLNNSRRNALPSYPRKRVSRLIWQRANLDSRLRGNDDSWEERSISTRQRKLIDYLGSAVIYYFGYSPWARFTKVSYSAAFRIASLTEKNQDSMGEELVLKGVP